MCVELDSGHDFSHKHARCATPGPTINKPFKKIDGMVLQLGQIDVQARKRPHTAHEVQLSPSVLMASPGSKESRRQITTLNCKKRSFQPCRRYQKCYIGSWTQKEALIFLVQVHWSSRQQRVASRQYHHRSILIKTGTIFNGAVNIARIGELASRKLFIQ